MASSSQGDNCLIFPVPLYTVTTVGIIKSYESFEVHINRVVITKGNIVDKIMVFSIIYESAKRNLCNFWTVSDSLVVQIEDL